MPVYNAEKYLAEAIASIQGQTFKDFELIIIDDGSTDASREIIRQYAKNDPRIIFRRNARNLMISRTLNVGLAEARGKYVVRMDADDISLPRRLEIQWKYMEAHPEVGVAGGVMQLMDENGQDLGRRIYHQEDREIRQHLFRYSPFSHPTIILRKAVLDQCGGYDPQYDLAEDYELYFRLGRVAKFGNVPDTLLRYRVAKKSLTAQVARRMELKTLEIRRKAATDYGYTPTPGDRLYGFLQWLSIFLIPVKLKKAVFTWWRSF